MIETLLDKESLQNVLDLAVIDDDGAKDISEEIREQLPVRNSIEFEDDHSVITYKDDFSKLTVFIVDLRLGKKAKSENDGIKVINHLRTRNPLACIIVYSAHTKDTMIRNKCRKNGADKFVHKRGENDVELKEILKHIVDYYNEIYTYLGEFDNRLKKKFQMKKIYNSEVIDISRDKVLLSFSIDNNDENAKELWFDKERVDNLDNIAIGNCYYMKDTITKYGKSCLKFEFTENDLFQHEKGLEEELNKIDDPKDFYENE